MNTNIITLLQEVLGTYIQQKDEFLFNCAFCHSTKKKLSINISTNKWKCWVCGSKGGHIIWLLKKLNVSRDILQEFKKEFKDSDIKIYKETTANVVLQLPIEYKPLWEKQNTYGYLHAINYLSKRNITLEDIIRYRIGYCESGAYANRIILPSYNKLHQLNYFTGRLFYDGGIKYKNPPVSKNIIVFENMIDWSDHVILCEGMFDAIALRRNAIPLMGKTLPSAVEKQLLDHKTQRVTIFLDEDARTDALKIEQRLLQHNINVRVVLTKGKDASEMGFNTAWNEICEARPTTFKELIMHGLYK